MSTVGDLLVFCGRMVVLLLGFGLRISVAGFDYAHTAFPETTNTILVVIGIYVAYRFIKRVIRMWINFVLSIIKTALTVLLIALLFAIYLRGFHRFFTKDIYFLSSMVKLAADEKLDYKKTSYNYAYKMFDGGQYDFLRRGAQALLGKNDVTVEDFNGIKDEFIAENVEGVKNFLRDNGINANRMNDFFNNIRF